LLAGPLTPEYAAAVRDEYADLVSDGRLVLMDRFLSVEELANSFAALDLHCSVYQSFSGLSSLMLKSVAAGVPVLVNDQRGWTRAIARRFGIGRAVDPQDVAGFGATLREALDASADYRETPAVQRLLQFHSIDNFTAGLTERASAFAGKAPVEVIQWPWVLDALPAERRALR
jgi:glycosyltransferase involved in cell wall biosynthesis